MADIPSYVYANAIKNAFIGGLDWDTNTIKCALLTAYTPDEDHETFSVDVLGAGTEHANSNGYTTGGATLGSKTNVCSGGVTTLACASIVWTASGTLTAKYAIFYDSDTDKVIAYAPLNGGSDLSTVDDDLTIGNPSGIFTIDVSP